MLFGCCLIMVVCVVYFVDGLLFVVFVRVAAVLGCLCVSDF